MELTVHIPDDIAERLVAPVNGDLARLALEVENYSVDDFARERGALKGLGFRGGHSTSTSTA